MTLWMKQPTPSSTAARAGSKKGSNAPYPSETAAKIPNPAAQPAQVALTKRPLSGIVGSSRNNAHA